MKKKMILALAMLVLTGLIFVACTGDAPNDAQPLPAPEITPEYPTAETLPNSPAQGYRRLTVQEYHEGGFGAYAFFLTDVEEQGDRLLLRGVFASEWLPYEKLEEARTGMPIEINGETFTHSFVYFHDNEWPTDILHNAHTGVELNLSPNGMMALVDSGGLWHSAWYSMGIYREIEIGRYTSVDRISAIDAFSGFAQPYMVDGLFLGDSLWFHFDEHGEIVRVSVFWDFCAA